MTDDQRAALLALYYVSESPEGLLNLYRIRGGYERTFDTQNELDMFLDDVVQAVDRRMKGE